MNYTTATSISVAYVIPKGSVNNTADNYHLEVRNISAGTRSMVSGASVVAATSTTVGSATFSGVSLPNDGTYLIEICYSNSGDLDGAVVTALTSTSVYKITSVSSITV